MHSYAKILYCGLKLGTKLIERHIRFFGIDKHYHYEVAVHNGLRNIFYIDIALGECAGNGGDDTRSVFSYDRYYCFHGIPVTTF